MRHGDGGRGSRLGGAIWGAGCRRGGGLQGKSAAGVEERGSRRGDPVGGERVELGASIPSGGAIWGAGWSTARVPRARGGWSSGGCYTGNNRGEAVPVTWRWQYGCKNMQLSDPANVKDSRIGSRHAPRFYTGDCLGSAFPAPQSWRVRPRSTRGFGGAGSWRETEHALNHGYNEI